MTNEQRKLIIKLIDYCNFNKFTLLKYDIGGGVQEIPDTARVINDYGNNFDIEYINNLNEWVRPQIKDDDRNVKKYIVDASK